VGVGAHARVLPVEDHTRTRIQNVLQSIALANGLRRGTALWSQKGQNMIASLPLRVTRHNSISRFDVK